MTAFELNPSVLHVFLMDISGVNIQVLKILDKDEGEKRSQSPETRAVHFDGI
jgi:hypothetical protein